MRDVAKVPFASPPKPKRLSSNFEASCGLTREISSTYNSFPESKHVLAPNKLDMALSQIRTNLPRVELKI
jgi:hypothetical protein